MKISINEHRDFVLEEVYNPVVFKSQYGEQISVCMRDTGFEIIYNGVRHDFKEGIVESYYPECAE